MCGRELLAGSRRRDESTRLSPEGLRRGRKAWMEMTFRGHLEMSSLFPQPQHLSFMGRPCSLWVSHGGLWKKKLVMGTSQDSSRDIGRTSWGLHAHRSHPLGAHLTTVCHSSHVAIRPHGDLPSLCSLPPKGHKPQTCHLLSMRLDQDRAVGLLHFPRLSLSHQRHSPFPAPSNLGCVSIT